LTIRLVIIDLVLLSSSSFVIIACHTNPDYMPARALL